jgi:hypothetical protein
MTRWEMKVTVGLRNGRALYLPRVGSASRRVPLKGARSETQTARIFLPSHSPPTGAAAPVYRPLAVVFVEPPNELEDSPAGGLHSAGPAF